MEKNDTTKSDYGKGKQQCRMTRYILKGVKVGKGGKKGSENEDEKAKKVKKRQPKRGRKLEKMSANTKM